MDAVKEVVYLSWVPLTEKVERDWYLAYLSSQGVTVSYWDLTALLFAGVEFQASLHRDYLEKVASYRQLEGLLAGKDPARNNYVMLVNYEARFNRLYRMLADHHCRLFFFEWGNFPIKHRGRTGKYLGLLRHPGKFLTIVRERCAAAITARLKPVKPFDVVFSAGHVSASMHPAAGRQVPVNLCDYDNFLTAKEKPQILPNVTTAVFLDINLAFQSDIKVIGWDYVNAREYGAALNRFFGMVEEKYRVRVVIAAHPKADYDDGYFEGRTILKGVTPELVKDADFVISHHSTSISYAVLNGKPLLFIYTDAMEKAYADTIVAWIGDFAQYLGQPVYNIDRVTDAGQIRLTEPDPERYHLYKYNYLTSKQSEGKLNRDIVLAELTA